MKHIGFGIYVGSQADFLELEAKGAEELARWHVLHACKEPHHRDFLGYTERAAPKISPEYLVARRDNRLALNMIDVANKAYLPQELFDAAVAFVDEAIAAARPILIHCNQGHSRGPTIALYVLNQKGVVRGPLDEALEQFRADYPDFAPAQGCADFLADSWRA